MDRVQSADSSIDEDDEGRDSIIENLLVLTELEKTNRSSSSSSFVLPERRPRIKSAMSQNAGYEGKTTSELRSILEQKLVLTPGSRSLPTPPASPLPLPGSPSLRERAPTKNVSPPIVLLGPNIPNKRGSFVFPSPQGSPSAIRNANSPAQKRALPSPRQSQFVVSPLALANATANGFITNENLPSPTEVSLLLTMPNGQQVLMKCSSIATTQTFLADSYARLKEYLDPSVSLDAISLVGDDSTTFAPDDVLASMPYISSHKADTVVPTLMVQVNPTVIPTIVTPAIEASYDTTSEMASSSFPSPRSTSIMKDTASFKYIAKQIREFPVQFLLPSGQTIVTSCFVDWTITVVKEHLHKEAARFHLRPMDNYILKTPSVDGYLSDESLQIGSIPFVETCRNESTTPKLILVERSTALSKKEKMIKKEIGSLIGISMSLANNDNEIAQFRKSMTWVRHQEKQSQEQHDLKSSLRKSSGELSSPITSSKIYIKLRLPLIESTLEKTVIGMEGETATEFLEKMFTKYYEKPLNNKGLNKRASDFVLKATGFADYITGDKELTSFDYIKSSMVKNQEIKLSLVESEINENDLYIEDFPDEEFLQDPIIKFDHDEIASEKLPWDQLTTISIWEMNRPFRFKIIGVENIKARPDILEKSDSLNLFITAGVYHGGELIAPLLTSQLTGFNANPRWYEWLTASVQMSHLPRAARICFTLYARSASNNNKDKDDIPLGWVSCQLVDYKHEIRMGLMSLNMWPEDHANPIGTCVGNSNPNAATIFIEFDTFPLPVVFPTEHTCKKDEVDPLIRKGTISLKLQKLTGLTPAEIQKNKDTIDRLAATDPLYPLTESDKKTLWDEREYCRTKPRSLPKLLDSVTYNDRQVVQVMHEFVAGWPLISSVDALELLDSKFGDWKVRSYAVQCLENLTDDELSDYQLQLIQVLKYEPYHDSALARFLLRRALRNRRIGHSFFWFLKAEMHVQEISERFGLLLEAYLRGCGSHRAELHKQTGLLTDLVRSANMIKGMKDTDRKPALLEDLAKIQFPGKIQLPLNPSIEVSGIRLEKCKYMDSKKLPLWVVFNNADTNGDAKYVIFKSGDDLRQDMLTLQMIRLMDKLWKNEGLDLELSPYGCISTGNDEGMIEVVLNSDTMANITKNAGGATAAFRADPLANWIRSHNPRDDQYAKAVDKFILSCAGYCVATYVLGIGDRHNDNVMLSREGKLFHIDFGHFLGNFKKKFGIKRERAPFVFTPDFAYVMGGRDSKDFLKFVDLCCKSYNILRKHANIFINLFAMMLSTGIPELTSIDDISYLREAFSLDATDEKAREKFKNLIYDSLATKTTQLNNAIHILAH